MKLCIYINIYINIYRIVEIAKYIEMIKQRQSYDLNTRQMTNVYIVFDVI